ncbi:mucin-binding protein [Levilactobacillus acidifarinae]|uniref:Gram-positive cocci surface proteins LPxTG domain-containing protein n=1 Tax=Levilactobacillus acidifarinae DSM 19394 = JCM 15949 TaxID=1423715 RepID=A0A0R1LK83_9LACO|nr:LPXTG cell wall anchor domain-containing protein [Levilactobacillus acidifarinae]KRK96318.1 hypothetical protein FD25_GL001806 [Levilactobacillus acidifarinae DSM 19394]GEO69103.1 hypothetical protein LAC03_10130 [Levilactobacillus acidifarinae]
MMQQDVTANNKRKWWITSSLATAVLTGMVLTGTTAQAETTTTPVETTSQSTSTPANSKQATITTRTVGEQAKADATAPVTPTADTQTSEQTTQAEDTAATPETVPSADDTSAVAPETPTAGTETQPATDTGNQASPTETEQPATEKPTSTMPQPSTPTNPTATESDEDATTESTGTTPVVEAPATNEPTTTTPKATQADTKKGLSAAKAVPAALAATPNSDEISDDEDLSDRFDDPVLLAAVRKALNLKDGDAIYLDTIKNFGLWSSLRIDTTANGNYQPISSFKGLEILKYLPEKGQGVTIFTQLGTSGEDVKNIDFSPLLGIKLNWLDWKTDFWGSVTDNQLETITQYETDAMQNLEFTATNINKIHFTGMTTHQFEILAPFVQKILENSTTASQTVAFSGNSITDFSALNTLSPNTSSRVVGRNQYYQATDKIAYQPGDTVEVTSPMKGILGESIKYQVRYYQNDDSGDLVIAEPHEATIMENGQEKTVWKYTLVNPKLHNGQLVYGQFYYDDAVYVTYPENSLGQPMPNFELMAGAIVYQPIGEATSTATVTYVDDTTGATLTTENLTGDVGATSAYRTATTIKGYTDLGYELVTDDYPGDGVTFTSAAQAFTVHLKHGITTLNNSKRVTQTIHYVYADGTTAAPDYTAWLTFTRAGTRDQVTGEEIWGEWQNIDGQGRFAAKNSPVLTGYLADQAEVAAIDGITATSDDLTTTVTYTAREAQNILITYVDDTTGQTLHTEALKGDAGTVSDYRTAATIQDYLKQGYELVSDDYPATGAEFTADVQTFTVRLKHRVTTVGNSKRVTQTIHYVYANGTTAAPDYTAWLTFTRSGTRDEVTGVATWGEWQNIDGQSSFAAKTSPAIAGYTPDQTMVAAINGVTAASADVTTTVTYTQKGAVVPPVTPPVTPPVKPVEPENPDVDPGATKPDVVTPKPGPATNGNGAAIVTPARTRPAQASLAQPGSAQAVGTAAKRGTAAAAALTTTAASQTDQQATTLPQTNERATPWAWLGVLGVTLLGWVGLRRKKD